MKDRQPCIQFKRQLNVNFLALSVEKISRPYLSRYLHNFRRNMVKLTAEIIQNSMQYINPVKDRELDLRGYRIPEIENLGATGDQFDTIDFSDNDIRKLDGFPYLKRLKCLFFNNNRIVRIGEHLEEYIPNVESLVLTGNHLEELSDIEALITLEKLSSLSLLHNPITSKQHYRLYLIYKLPQLKLLDFRKVKLKEREEAKALFKSKKGKEIRKEINKRAKTFVPGGNSLNNVGKNNKMSEEELAKVREAITNACSLEEVDRLHKILESGQIPGDDSNGLENGNNGMDYE